MNTQYQWIGMNLFTVKYRNKQKEWHRATKPKLHMFFAKPWVCCGLEKCVRARAFGEEMLLYFRRLGPIFTNMPPQIFPRKKAPFLT
jgi:hypothetical protein